jgi:hypothetical protein
VIWRSPQKRLPFTPHLKAFEMHLLAHNCLFPHESKEKCVFSCLCVSVCTYGSILVWLQRIVVDSSLTYCDIKMQVVLVWMDAVEGHRKKIFWFASFLAQHVFVTCSCRYKPGTGGGPGAFIRISCIWLVSGSISCINLRRTTIDFLHFVFCVIVHMHKNVMCILKWDEFGGLVWCKFQVIDARCKKTLECRGMRGKWWFCAASSSVWWIFIFFCFQEIHLGIPLRWQLVLQPCQPSLI